MRSGILALLAMLLLVPAAAIAQPATDQTAPRAEYRLGGVPALKPSQIWDDGYRTYIVWRADAELPAVFSRGSDGKEILAEGAMRGDHYVLDRVHSLLIFRIDRSSATARRKGLRRE